jgi:YVTN family beta-propeller protein
MSRGTGGVAGAVALVVLAGVMVLTSLPGLSSSPTPPAAATPLSLATVPTAARYPVNFTESGLPAGSIWTVTLGNATLATSSRSEVFYASNGTYNYTVDSVGGFVPLVATGTVAVHGGNNTVVATLSTTGANPWGGAAVPGSGNVFMSYHQNGNLSIINGTTNANHGSLVVGHDPDVPVFDPVDGNLYVPNWGSNNVTVVNPTTHARVANIPVGDNPRSRRIT